MKEKTLSLTLLPAGDTEYCNAQQYQSFRSVYTAVMSPLPSVTWLCSQDGVVTFFGSIVNITVPTQTGEGVIHCKVPITLPLNL